VPVASAAALPVNYLTAYQMLCVMAPVGPDNTVLIHSAAGGVGIAALQICRLRGATVIGSASVRKHAFLKDQGAAHVFDSHARRFAQNVREVTDGRGADVVLEPRHGSWIAESYRALAKTGTLVLFGFSSATVGRGVGTWSALRTLAQVPWLRLNPVSLMNDNKAVAGVNLGRMWDEHWRIDGWMRELLDWAAAGRIAPHVDRIFPFGEAAAAHRQLEERRNVGKVLLAPDPALL
jgi:NADPH:quinone reductase-like Zn-dependent oxidoreductase